MKTKICLRCGQKKPLQQFRHRPNGFTLNQCRQCESELGKERRLRNTTSKMITITSKSGKVIEASATPIKGGRITRSDNTNKVLYFGKNISRDAARIAFSTFANIERTGIKFEKV